MQLNYFGVINVVHTLYGDMVRRDQGHICIVGSALSTFGGYGKAGRGCVLPCGIVGYAHGSAAAWAGSRGVVLRGVRRGKALMAAL